MLGDVRVNRKRFYGLKRTLETAYAISDAGQIVGRRSAGNNAFHAFEVVNGNTTDFSTLGGANGEALAINKNGLFAITTAGPANGRS